MSDALADRSTGSARLERLAGWVVAIAVIAAMGPVVTNGFGPIDDDVNITENPHLTPPRLTADGVMWFWGHPHMSLWAPVTYAVWGTAGKLTYVPTADEEGNHFDPHVFHAVSLLAHVMAALAVFGVIRRTMGKTWPAVIGAILFGVHPIQVEAVAWTSGLKDVLCGCFGITAIYFYVRAVQESGRVKCGWFYVAATVAFVLAMLSKPSGVVIPLVAAAIDVGLLRRPVKRVAPWVGLWMVLAIPVAFVAKLAQRAEVVSAPPVWERPVVALGAIGFYLRKIVWPAGLSFDYAWRPVELVRQPWFYAVATAVVVMGIALWAGRKRWPGVAVGGVVLVVALLPMLGLVRFEFMFFSIVADHYAYVAMLGVAIAIAWLFGKGMERGSGAPLVSIIVLVVLGVMSWWQIPVWRDERTIADWLIAGSPRGAWGFDLKALHWEREAKPAMAIPLFEKAAVNLPAWRGPHEGLARDYYLTGQSKKAIAQLGTLIELVGRQSEAGDNYVRWLAADGARAAGERRYADAAMYFRALAEYRPEDPQVERALATAEALADRAATQPVTPRDARRTQRNVAATRKALEDAK